MWEECGNLRRRLVKNKNIFQFNHIVGSNNRTLIINASKNTVSEGFIAQASIKESDLFEVNNQVVDGRNDSVFRTGTIMNFEFIVRDRVRFIGSRKYSSVT